MLFFNRTTDKLRRIHSSNRHLSLSLPDVNEFGENVYPFLKGRKGGYHLVHDNYIYRSNFRRQGVQRNIYYWECINNRKGRCRGRLKTIADKLYVANSNGKQSRVDFSPKHRKSNVQRSLFFQFHTTTSTKAVVLMRHGTRVCCHSCRLTKPQKNTTTKLQLRLKWSMKMSQ